MAEVTYFVALPFFATDDCIAAGEPMDCFNPSAVVMRAEALSRKEGPVGAVAFSRTGDPATGDFSDAKVLKKFGDVPDDHVVSSIDGDMPEPIKWYDDNADNQPWIKALAEFRRLSIWTIFRWRGGGATCSSCALVTLPAWLRFH
jgi:hypothetical protein